MATIKLNRSNTPGHEPASLEDGEVAVNQADGVFFWRDETGAVQRFDLGGSSDWGLITGAVGTTDDNGAIT